MNLVTVETFWSVEEAQLALGFLQAEGIPCRLESLAFASNFWHLANASHGVKLLVTGEEADRAAALLVAAEDHRASDSADEFPMDGSPFDPDSTLAEQEDFAPDPDSDGDNQADDDDESHPGLLTRLRKLKPLALWFIVIGG